LAEPESLPTLPFFVLCHSSGEKTGKGGGKV